MNEFPGFANVHSHAFQYAIAGLTEKATCESGSFWTWREKMYEAVAKFNPELLKEVAAKLYMEMLKKGFTSVGEFHYLHHKSNGNPYSNPTAMAEALIAAAEQTGIQLTLLPVLYTYSGFDRKGLKMLENGDLM